VNIVSTAQGLKPTGNIVFLLSQYLNLDAGVTTIARWFLYQPIPSDALSDDKTLTPAPINIFFLADKQ
jgi:hypothetical protein